MVNIPFYIFRRKPMNEGYTLFMIFLFLIFAATMKSMKAILTWKLKLEMVF